MKRRIILTESDLRHIVKESVRRILKENTNSLQTNALISLLQSNGIENNGVTIFNKPTNIEDGLRESWYVNKAKQLGFNFVYSHVDFEYGFFSELDNGYFMTGCNIMIPTFFENIFEKFNTNFDIDMLKSCNMKSYSEEDTDGLIIFTLDSVKCLINKLKTYN